MATNANFRYEVDPLHIKMTEGKTDTRSGTIGGAMDYVGEIAQSSQFKLNLYLSGQGTDGDNDLNKWLKECGLYGNNANDDRLKYDLLCHQAQLPGTQFDLATERGGFQGVTETFARHRQFTQFAVSFYIDTNYHIIRVFEEWMNFINPLHTSAGKSKQGSAAGSLFRSADQDRNNFFRMRYPNTYKKDISITKFERNAGFKLQNVYTKEQQSNHLTYNFVNAFPIQIGAVDMSYGASQLLKVDVVFNYDRYTTMKHNASNPAPSPTNLAPETQEQLNQQLLSTFPDVSGFVPSSVNSGLS